MQPTNPKIAGHEFLADMARDDYFPPALVARGQAILVELCLQIEREAPKTLEELYTLTHRATERFNSLNEQLQAQESEIETTARENIGADFELIAKAYGFDADVEQLIATRDW